MQDNGLAVKTFGYISDIAKMILIVQYLVNRIRITQLVNRFHQ